MSWQGLRLHDNAALKAAAEGAAHVHPIFIIDPWFMQPERYSAPALVTSPERRRRGLVRAAGLWGLVAARRQGNGSHQQQHPPSQSRSATRSSA